MFIPVHDRECSLVASLAEFSEDSSLCVRPTFQRPAHTYVCMTSTVSTVASSAEYSVEYSVEYSEYSDEQR